MSESRPLDDTPTRLQQDARVIHSSEIADDPAGFEGDYVPLEDHQQTWDTAQRLRADVSRLRKERDLEHESAEIWKFNADKHLADVSRLQQEHALLRRSLDILVKQMADAGV
jgi:hypothetical protein